MVHVKKNSLKEKGLRKLQCAVKMQIVVIYV